MEKISFKDKKVYVISVADTGIPYLMLSQFFLVYTNLEAAQMEAARIGRKYGTKKVQDGHWLYQVQVREISDVSLFFHQMNSYDICRFILDGDSKVYGKEDIEDLKDIDSDQFVSDVTKRVIFWSQWRQFGKFGLGSKGLNAALRAVKGMIYRGKLIQLYSSDNSLEYFSNNQKWYPMFTDEAAILKSKLDTTGYTMKMISITEVFSQDIYRYGSYTGVIVNPGREYLKFNKSETVTRYGY